MSLIPEGCHLVALRDTEGFDPLSGEFKEGVVAIWSLRPGGPLRCCCAPTIDRLIGVMRAACAAEHEPGVISIEGDAWLAALSSAMRRLWRGRCPARSPGDR